MNESKHTPTIRRYGSNGHVIVETDGDMQCAHFADFANVQESDCAFGGTDIDAVANLALAVRDAFPAGSPRLLAAAPELLDALETLLNECEKVDYKDGQFFRFQSFNPDVIRKAAKAINKAKGTSHSEITNSSK